MNKACIEFSVKSLDEDQRILRGWATTKTLDRVNDRIDPLGATFSDNVKLLASHDHTRPIGRVKFGQPSPEGVPFEARIAKITEPGPLKDRCDTAWGEVKHGLVDSVSIGFQPTETPVPNNMGGLDYPAIEIFELSLVAVPANPDARVLETRAAQQRQRKIPAPPSRGRVIVDEQRHIRRARAALVRFLGEKKVPRFASLAALEKWEANRQREARAKGTVPMSYEAMMRVAPIAKPARVVRLRP